MSYQHINGILNYSRFGVAVQTNEAASLKQHPDRKRSVSEIGVVREIPDAPMCNAEYEHAEKETNDKIDSI